MKNILYKTAVLILSVWIFICAVSAIKANCDRSEYVGIVKAAEANSGIPQSGAEIPTASSEAPENIMRTERSGITAEDLSYFYLNGIKFDFPCPLSDIEQHFEVMETNIFTYNADENLYYRNVMLLKGGISVYQLTCVSSEQNAASEDQLVTSIKTLSYSEKYTPQFVTAGIDVNNTSEEEFFRLADFGNSEYISHDSMFLPAKDGYLLLNMYGKELSYHKNKNNGFVSDKLLVNELHLDGDAAENTKYKDETKEFVRDYFPEREDITFLDMTAYEYLSEHTGEYFELTRIFSLIDSENNSTGYLAIDAQTTAGERFEIIVRDGEPIGSGIVIKE